MVTIRLTFSVPNKKNSAFLFCVTYYEIFCKIETYTCTDPCAVFFPFDISNYQRILMLKWVIIRYQGPCRNLALNTLQLQAPIIQQQGQITLAIILSGSVYITKSQIRNLRWEWYKYSSFMSVTRGWICKQNFRGYPAQQRGVTVTFLTERNRWFCQWHK